MGPARGSQLSLFGLLSDEQPFSAESVRAENSLTREHLVAVHDEPARASIEHFLRERVPFPVRVVVTDNTRTMLSVRPHGSVRDVRLHHMFLDAPTTLLHSLAQYVQNGNAHASRVIDDYIAKQQHRVRPPAPTNEQRLRPRGRVYQLDEVQNELSEHYFSGSVRLPITWGNARVRANQKGRRRTMRLGAYLLDERLIRVHPALDQAFVPRYFLDWVVYHEMLHHEIPMALEQGRRVYHPPEFRRRERLFADYERARTWEREHLHRLVTPTTSP